MDSVDRKYYKQLDESRFLRNWSKDTPGENDWEVYSRLATNLQQIRFKIGLRTGARALKPILCDVAQYNIIETGPIV